MKWMRRIASITEEKEVHSSYIHRNTLHHLFLLLQLLLNKTHYYKWISLFIG